MLGENLPIAGVMDLILHQPTRTLVAATHGRSMYSIDVSNVTAIKSPTVVKPEDFQLTGIYPNPFNSEVTIKFNLSKSLTVEATIFDLLGRKVTALTNEKFSPGEYRLKWDGKSINSATVASGTYLVRLKAGDQQIVQAVTYVK